MIQDYTQYVSGNDFLNKNADVKNAETNFDYNSFYRAYVINNNDPQKLGRIQIQIPAKGSNTVWAYPGLFSGLGFQTGTMILPPIGSLVFVTFEYSDEHKPIYFGGIPTKYAEGKSQSYGPFINNGNARKINDNDIPFEYTGTQQIIYKSPQGNIIYIDDADSKNSIFIKNLYNQQFKIAREYNVVDNTTNNYIEMRFNDDNYLQLKDGSFKWVSDGVDVPIGNVGNAQTVLWEVD